MKCTPSNPVGQPTHLLSVLPGAAPRTDHLLTMFLFPCLCIVVVFYSVCPELRLGGILLSREQANLTHVVICNRRPRGAEEVLWVWSTG